MIKKQYIVKRESSDEENTATAAISTDTVDRDREVLLPKGAELENYQKNPVVLWAHDYSGTPVGLAQWIKAGRKYIKAKWKWATTSKAQEIKELWEGGFLNAISVGFISKEGHEPTPKDIEKIPAWAEARRIIDKWELLEFSIVPVPANPDALAGIKALNISDATQKELGIDVETTLYITKDTEETNTEETKVEVKEEPKDKPVIVVAHRMPVMVRVINKSPVKVGFDRALCIDNLIKRKKGRMYP